MANSVQPVRGQDYLPHEVKVRDAIKSIIHRSYEQRFLKIQTPILEDIDRLDKSEGGENLNMSFASLKGPNDLDKKASQRKILRTWGFASI